MDDNNIKNEGEFNSPENQPLQNKDVASQDDQTAETLNEMPSNTIKKYKLPKKHVLLILALIGTLLVGVGGTTAFFMSKENAKNSNTNEEQIVLEDNENEEADIVDVENIEPFIKDYQNSVFNQKSGEVWLTTRKKIEKPKFLSTIEEYEDNAYYEVGSRDNKTIIMHALFGLGETVNFYEVDSSGNATVMLNYNNQYSPEYSTETTPIEKAGITIDKDTIYDSLTLPGDGFTLDNGFKLHASLWGIYVLDGPYEYSTSSNEFYKGMNKIQDTKNGAFYSKSRTIEYEDPIIELKEIGFYYRTPVGIAFGLTYKPFGSSKVSDFNFTRGSTVAEDAMGTYVPITRGCGFSSAYTSYPKITDKDVVKVGTAQNGQAVYGLVDTNYKILTKYVEEIASFSSNKVDKQELLDNNALIFSKNINNEWEVYGSPSYTQFGGCAKPVVYLYPEKPTLINVSVGADVKVSEPHYEKDGWQHVLAEPSGYLHYNGKVYDSLFWEGPGRGEYPLVTSGTIVQTRDAISTIQSQMALMGFNEKEIADFVEYWSDKLPSKPYTRLTWLQTAEMESLAPLYINPKPDSMLRAFLDYEGLEKPYNLPKQNLLRVERSGYTVTEWGGLTPFRIY